MRCKFGHVTLEISRQRNHRARRPHHPISANVLINRFWRNVYYTNAHLQNTNAHYTSSFTTQMLTTQRILHKCSLQKCSNLIHECSTITSMTPSCSHFRCPKAVYWYLRGDSTWAPSRRALTWCSSHLKNNHFAEMRSGSEEGSYLRLIDLCITQL